MRRWPVALFAAATLSLCASGASAQMSPEPASSERASSERASSADDDARYAWLLAELTANGRSERKWWAAWSATFVVLAAGQGAAVGVLSDEGLRADAAVGAVKSALGLLALLVTPRTAQGAALRLREMDARTPEARRLRRVRAEELLRASANDEDFGTSWVPHVAAAAVNLAGAYVLFHEYDRYAPGWLSLASGTLVAEVQIVTRPVGAISAWNRYARGDAELDGSAPPAAARPATPLSSLELRCTASPAWTGLVLGGSF